MTPTVVVVGLGPAGADLLTVGASEALASAGPLFVRTTRHPAATALRADAVSFDDVYETAASMDEVYATIVDRLATAATEYGRVTYAVPGSPWVAERTVRLLADDDRVAVEVLPALSFLDLAWVRLGVDPIEAGVRIVDGHRFAVEAAGAVGDVLVCQCDTPDVLSDIKLAVDEWPEVPAVVLQRLGLPDERVVEVEWADLDRVVEPDHLTSVLLRGVGVPVAAELVRFDELVHALRAGCPWDRSQTHRSLQRYLLEETYELLEAIDGLGDDDPEPDGAAIDDLQEELGDVLFQVFFHATIAAEQGWFTLADVAAGIHDKLYERHPHVFGDATFESNEALAASWEAQKKAEKSRESVMDGIPAELPALLRATKVTKKAAASGFTEPLDERATALDLGSLDADAAGDLLLSIVDAARRAGFDAEDLLRRASNRYVERFERASRANPSR